MYSEIISNKLQSLKESGQYREFVTINRIRGQYPLAHLNGQQDTEPVVVWCSNDYLGMSQHPVVTEAMHDAIQQVRIQVRHNDNVYHLYYGIHLNPHQMLE